MKMCKKLEILVALLGELLYIVFTKTIKSFRSDILADFKAESTSIHRLLAF